MRSRGRLSGSGAARRLDPYPFALLFLLLGRRNFRLGLFLGLRLLEIGDGELELLDKLLASFGGLPKLLSSGPGEHEFQPLDLESANLRLALALRPTSRAARGSLRARRQGLPGVDRKASSQSDSIIFATENRARSTDLLK